MEQVKPFLEVFSFLFGSRSRGIHVQFKSINHLIYYFIPFVYCRSVWRSMFPIVCSKSFQSWYYQLSDCIVRIPDFFNWIVMFMAPFVDSIFF